MHEMSLEALQKLNRDSVKLNKQLEEINALLDDCHSSTEGMADVTSRIGHVFVLYRELILEMQKMN